MTNFEEALTAMRQGQKVKRAEWMRWVFLQPLKKRFVQISEDFGVMPRYIGEGDILAEDWEIQPQKEVQS